MTMTEAEEQAKFVRWAKREGLFVRKVESVGTKGFPDLFVGNPHNERHMLVEMKAADGRESAHQKQTIKFLRSCGVHVAVCWSYEQAVAAADAYLRGPVHLGRFGA